MEKIIEKVKKELGIVMVNADKVDRAVLGVATGKGRVGGVGEDAPSEVVLAKYDLMHGFTTKDGYKVKHGTFVNLKTGEPVKNPKIVLLIKVNGNLVEQAEDAPESLEVKIAKKQTKEKKQKGEDK